MEQEFFDILTEMLEKLDANPDGDIDSQFEEIIAKYNLSEEDIALLKETNGYIDAFADNAESLEAAKEDGLSTREWMAARLDNILEGRSEEECEAVEAAILAANEKQIDAEIEEPDNEK